MILSITPFILYWVKLSLRALCWIGWEYDWSKKAYIDIYCSNFIVPMINPVILKKEKLYETEESCLSLIGFRKTKRYEMIEV